MVNLYQLLIMVLPHSLVCLINHKSRSKKLHRFSNNVAGWKLKQCQLREKN
jgi:hypothetical protein